MKSHKDLDVWKSSVALATMIYRATRACPAEERFGLVGQMRRAAISIASNIAEGAARQTQREFRHFLHVAAGSANELDTQLEISTEIGMLTPESIGECRYRLDQISRMLQGLIKSLNRDE